MDSVAWRFGNFTLLADRRLLMAEGMPVRLGGRALDILIALVEYAGQFVSREELISRIWGERVVEEVNLRVQVAAVRRVLGDDDAGQPQFILNVPRKGYCFVAPVTRASDLPVIPTPARTADLASSSTTLVGRGSSIDEIRRQLQESRFVTIVGAGGVGKSAIASSVAAAESFRYPDGVRRVDLGGLTDVEVAAARIGDALGRSSDVSHDTRAAVSAAHEGRLLLLLDGCEGVIELAAIKTESIRAGEPSVHILATSREPLRVPGEQVHRLGPFAVRSPEALSPEEWARSSPSVQLFSDRARAASANFDFLQEDARLIQELCHRLDGIPLALELAAHRVEHLGLAGILKQLDEGFDVLADERRADVPRQRSLRASFEWSFVNLKPEEQRVLCRLSLFAGHFSLANGAILATDDEAESTAREIIGQLATKSLLSVDPGAHGVRYRMTGSTRDYARRQLRNRDDHLSTGRRHAELTIRLLEAADSDRSHRLPHDWLQRHAELLDDVRSALDWLAANHVACGLEMRLLAVSAPLWYQLSAVGEYCDRATQIVSAPLGFVDDTVQIRVTFALGRARLHVFGQSEHSSTIVQQTLLLAQRRNDPQAVRMATWGLWLDHYLTGRYHEALSLAAAYESLSKSVKAAQSVDVDRMLLVSLLHLGRFAEARIRGERALASIRLMPVSDPAARPQLEQEAIVKANLARASWIQGSSDSAMAAAREAVDLARRSMHDITTCFCLHSLCIVALWTGNSEEAKRTTLALSELARNHGLGLWAAWSRFHQDAIEFVQGNSMRPDWREPTCGVPQLELMATFSTDLLEPELVQRVEAGDAPWCEPEVLRARGCHAARMQTEQGRHQARALFGRALELAQSQGALSWELRAATSIAHVLDRPEEASMAIGLLTRTLEKFTEGFSTPDLRNARAVLAKRRAI